MIQLFDCPPKKENTEMVKQAKTNVAGEINKLNEHETSEVLNYISTILSARHPKSKDNSTNDDLIVSLQDAYENKRARQVSEWESARRNGFRISEAGVRT